VPSELEDKIKAKLKQLEEKEQHYRDDLSLAYIEGAIDVLREVLVLVSGKGEEEEKAS